MSDPALRLLPREACERVLEARDPRFDGVFFVGLETSRIYCRPGCPSRRAIAPRCSFFDSALDAQRAGYRPCRRCHPDAFPSAWSAASTQLASLAAQRIISGALNGQSVASLAANLNVSERHLRRALRDEMGVSPLELAQANRLTRARRLLLETPLNVTRIAFASGFQSLRRFNVVFRERYGMSPSDLRRQSGLEAAPHQRVARGLTQPFADPVKLTISYRPPYAWDAMVRFLAREAIPGVEVVDARRYARTVQIQGRRGYVSIEPAPALARVEVQASPSLLPVLPALLMRVRHLLDLDAQPSVIDTHLRAAGLGALVQHSPGVRVPGAFDGFEIALAAILRWETRSVRPRQDLVARVVESLGGTLENAGISGLQRLTPSPERVAEAGHEQLVALGVPERSARALKALAHRVACGCLHLEPGNVAATYGALMSIDGLGPRLAANILMRTAHWPDASPSWMPDAFHLANDEEREGLDVAAENFRPWRAYAAMHWWICAVDDGWEDHGSHVPAPPRTKPMAHLDSPRSGMLWKQRMASRH